MTASSHRLLLARLEGAYHQFNESESELARGKLIGLLLAAELSQHSSPKSRTETLARVIRELRRSQNVKGEALDRIFDEIPAIAADLERRCALVVADKVRKERKRIVI